ncbi:MAG: 3,4-dihydroxy-2-butanone-4-phosphate synthase [Gammaproteobacteria bacterium]
MSFAKIADAIRAIGEGRMIVVVDDESRENEGDLIVAADLVKPEHIAFMMRRGQGLICVSLAGERLDELGIPLMVENNTDLHSTAFTVTVDYKFGTSTGISAGDRAVTARALVNPASRPSDFTRPGHLFPLRAHPLGVLGRPGHTEAAIDLTRLANLTPGGVICEIAKDDGTMARLDDLLVLAEQYSLPIIAIKDLIEYVGRRNAIEMRQLDVPLRAFSY